jgi:penicillin amidase
MHKATRFALSALAVATAATLVAGAGLSVYAMRSLPPLAGSLSLPGLSAPAQVRRDASDVTHIFAQTPLDAFRTLGMVHAQERAWQLEFNRRVIHGTLSEVLGPATLQTDKLLRTLGIARAAQAQWEGLPDHAKAALQAYADGVNAAMASGTQARTPEFVVLGIDPATSARQGQFWTPQDAMGWALMMALDLGGNWGNEFARLSALQVLDTQRLWELFPPYPGEAPASSTDLAGLYRSLGVFLAQKNSAGSSTPTPTKQAVTSLSESTTSVANNTYNTSATGQKHQKLSSSEGSHLAQGIVEWADALGHIEGKGSNNWVVAGSHTASGQPLLANDPHLGLSAPAIWYFARLQAPAAPGQGALDVVGATLPGMPFVVLGRNAHMAWGFTNTAPDVQDLYLEQINPANPAQYRIPAPNGQATAWADFATRDEVIRVKGQGDVRHTVRSTRHGPVLSDAQASHAQVLDTGKFVLSLRWSALDADNHTMLAGLEGNRAQNVGELVQAYRHYHSPMQNVVMADTQGQVVYKAAGKAPVRSATNDIKGIAPAPGWDARYDWQGWIPYAENPETRLTPVAGLAPLALASQRAESAQAATRGWLATANQRIHSTDYPHFLTQDWHVPYRQDRIENLLSATPQHTVASLQAIQGDQLSLGVPPLLALLQATTSDHPLAAQAMQQLQGFDGQMAADQAAPLIFTAWADALTREVLRNRLGAERFQAMYGKRHFRSALEGIVARDDAFWCGEGGCTAASNRALTTALTELQSRHGKQVAQWRWGDAHPAVSKHQPFSAVKPLARFFEVRVPTGGDAFTVNVGQFHLDNPDVPYANRHAASLRAVYDLANLDNSAFMYQTGQSGNVFSGHYRDMAQEWASIRYRPLQLAPTHWAHTLQVTP